HDVMGISVSVGIGKWVKEPEELIISHETAEKPIRYRYLLGQSLLLDMEELKPDQNISLTPLLEQLADIMKNGRQEDVESVLGEIKTAVRDSMVEKSRACMALQQIIRTVDRVCE